MLKKPIMAFVFSIIIGVLSVISTLFGLFCPEYFYEAPFLSGLFGQDFITLVIGAPLLFITTWLAFRKSRRGYLAWLGTLSYFLYTYCGYAFEVANNIFIIYIAIFSLSIFALIKGLSALDVEPINLWFSKNTPIRTLAGYSVVLGLFLAFFWLYPAMLFLYNGIVPEYAAFLGTLNTAQRVLDLGIVCPLAVIIGILLWKRRSWGYTLISIFLFKGIALGSTFVATSWFSVKWEILGYTTILFFGFLTIFLLIISYMFFKNLREEIIKSYHDRNSVSYF